MTDELNKIQLPEESLDPEVKQRQTRTDITESLSDTFNSSALLSQLIQGTEYLEKKIEKGIEPLKKDLFELKELAIEVKKNLDTLGEKTNKSFETLGDNVQKISEWQKKLNWGAAIVGVVILFVLKSVYNPFSEIGTIKSELKSELKSINERINKLNTDSQLKNYRIEQLNDMNKAKP